MDIVSLASGSKGNAYLAGVGGKWLLIDDGLSYRTFAKLLGAALIAPDDIVGAVFTHEHDDHVKGVEMLAKKLPELPLFANAMTADAIAEKCGVELDRFYLFENGQEFEVGPFTVHPFSIPHDVVDPVGYLVKAQGETYFHCTDCGTPIASVGLKLAEADYALLESNHDPVMLHNSNRAEPLKQRIRGPRGHLSNFDAAELVEKYATPKLKALALAHLSEECNAPHLAEKTMREALAKKRLNAVDLVVLSQGEIKWLKNCRK